MSGRTLAELHREMGRVQERRWRLRIAACNDPELVDALRARAWAEAGLPAGTEVRPNGRGWLTGLPDGWPEGVDADLYVERHVAAALGDDDGD